MQIDPKLYSAKMSDTKMAQQRSCKAEHWNFLCLKLPQCQISLRIGHVYLILLTTYKDNIVLFNKIFFLKLWWSQSSVKANYSLNSSTLLPTASKQEVLLLSFPIFLLLQFLDYFPVLTDVMKGYTQNQLFLSMLQVWQYVKTLWLPPPGSTHSQAWLFHCVTLSNNLPLQQMHWP